MLCNWAMFSAVHVFGIPCSAHILHTLTWFLFLVLLPFAPIFYFKCSSLSAPPFSYLTSSSHTCLISPRVDDPAGLHWACSAPVAALPATRSLQTPGVHQGTSCCWEEAPVYGVEHGQWGGLPPGQSGGPLPGESPCSGGNTWPNLVLIPVQVNTDK